MNQIGVRKPRRFRFQRLKYVNALTEVQTELREWTDTYHKQQLPARAVALAKVTQHLDGALAELAAYWRWYGS